MHYKSWARPSPRPSPSILSLKQTFFPSGMQWLPPVISICYYEFQNTCKTEMAPCTHLHWWLCKYRAWKWKTKLINQVQFPPLPPITYMFIKEQWGFRDIWELSKNCNTYVGTHAISQKAALFSLFNCELLTSRKYWAVVNSGSHFCIEKIRYDFSDDLILLCTKAHPINVS